jgi:hypothetical protein
MTENVDNLVLEHLRAIRGELGEVKRRVANIEIELNQMSRMMALLVEGQTHVRTRMTEFEARLERVERRLELRDDPVG